jgi:hypothetical protein
MDNPNCIGWIEMCPDPIATTGEIPQTDKCSPVEGLSACNIQKKNSDSSNVRLYSTDHPADEFTNGLPGFF